MRRLLLAGVLLVSSVPAFAEVNEVYVAQQYGVSFLPFMLMERDKLVEKHAKAAGLGELHVSWAKVAGPSIINDGLVSGSVHFAATAALVKAGLRVWDVDELANALDEAKLFETAFAVHSSLRHPQPPAQDLLHLRAGRSLRNERGPAEARAWFDKVMGPIDDMRGRNLALSGFRDHRPEEVWELIPAPKDGPGPGDTTWMLRAAAVALKGDPAPAEQRDTLKRHYATAPDSPHTRIGRYLVGLASDADAAAIVKNLPASCEVPTAH